MIIVLFVGILLTSTVLQLYNRQLSIFFIVEFFSINKLCEDYFKLIWTRSKTFFLDESLDTVLTEKKKFCHFEEHSFWSFSIMILTSIWRLLSNSILQDIRILKFNFRKTHKKI